MIDVLIASYGLPIWKDIAARRAIPSAQAQTDNVVVWHEPDGTVATSRNGAAARATGDWLCFLDADDELAAGYIAAMMRELEQDSVGSKVLLTPAVQQVRRGPRSKPFFYKECSLTTGNWLVIGTLISRDLFFKVGGFNEHPHGLEDWNLWARAVRAGATIHKVPDAIYIAHINPHSKHRKLARDRVAYQTAYEAARIDAWE